MTMQLHTDAAMHRAARTAVAAYTPLEFSEEQRRMIRETFANGASDSEFAVLMEVARARRLSPLLRQIHFVKRWDSLNRREVWSVQASIDGLRAIAERTGLYDGQDEPEFIEADGRLVACKVRVHRKDWTRPAVGVAYWDEYVQVARDKTTGKERPAAMWARMPHVMLAKCAESIALRKAFPEDIGGIYSAEEMAQSQGDGGRLEVVDEPANDAAEAPASKPAELFPPAQKASDALAKAILAAKGWDAAVALLPAQPDRAAGLALLERWQKRAAKATDAASAAKARAVLGTLPAWVRELAPAIDDAEPADGYTVEREPGEEG